MILNWKIEFPDQVADVGAQQTRLGRLASNDSFAQVTAAGYLNAIVSVLANQGNVPNQALGYVPLPQDFWLIAYNGGAGLFAVSINASGIVTLVPAGNASNYVSVPMTLAQFQGMYAAPFLLVPAQGSNLLIIANSMQIIQTYGSAALAAGGVVAAQYDSTVHGGGILATNSEQAADFFVTASNVYNFISASGNGSNMPFASCVNKGLYLSNATGAFTTGTGSSFVVDVKYSVVKVA